MNLVPKPEGFDFRNAKSDKSQQDCDWLPADVLFWVSREIAEKPATQAVVLWWEKTDMGIERLRWAHSTLSKAERILLLHTMLFETMKEPS